jgi:predicted  nucleic acid-binding Zn ribbon protein
VYVNRVSATSANPDKYSKDSVLDALQTVLAALHMNGQVCGSEWPMLASGETISAIVLSPEAQSLDARFNSKYVAAAMARCEDEGLLVTFEVLGEDAESPRACLCPDPSAYVLFTSYISFASPIRCMDCFRQVAMYRMKAMASGEFYELLSWQSDFQSCDSLQMHCTVLEKQTTREMSDIDSSLSKTGLAHCETLAASSNRPFYYYLYRGHGRSLHAELERRCPGCGSDWKLASQLHDLFDFKCDRCSLLSNVAFDVRWKSVP